MKTARGRKLICLMLIVSFILLSGCGSIFNPKKGRFQQATIEWTDFVKISNVTYHGMYNSIVTDKALITNQEISEVKFNVTTVTNPNYRIQSGDASYLKEGTKLYAVQGFDSKVIIAAPDSNTLGGYRLYTSQKQLELVKYDEISQSNIAKIEIYLEQEVTPLRVIEGIELSSVLHILNNGELKTNISYNMQQGDPIHYQLVFYTDEPLAYQFMLIDDNEKVVFHPWEPSVVSGDIREYLK